MTRRRRIVVSAFLALLLAGHAWVIAGDRGEEVQWEWPLLSYRMFSRVQRGFSMNKDILYGVVVGPDAREMPLWERQYIQPLTMRDVHWIAYDCRARPDGPAVLEAFLASVLDRYEAHRAARRHDGPPLQAVRLYREYWQARPGVIPPAPARRTLVAEFRTEAP